QTEAYGTAVSRTTTYLYDLVGNLTSTTTGQSSIATYQHVVTTSYAYDHLDRRTQVIEAWGTADQRTTTTGYDPNDNGVEALDPRGRLTDTHGDSLDRPDRVTEAVGPIDQRTTTTVYDKNDNVVATIDGRGIETDSTYDALNRRTAVTEAVGTIDQR